MLKEDNTLARFNTNALFYVDPYCPVMQAQTLAREQGFHHVPVVDHRRLVGMVATCDMDSQPSDTPVRELMREPVTLSVEHTREEARRLMDELQIGSIVIVEGDKPVGIVTRVDLDASLPPGHVS